MRSLLVSLLVAGVALFSTATMAQVNWLPEVRGGVMAHSVDEPGPDGALINGTRIEDANVELLFNSDLTNWAPFGELRPHLGATVNFGGLESMVYTGLSWTFQVPNTPLFVEGSLGGALHNGASHDAVAPARNLGCPLLFRESASVGWKVTENASIMATVEHASHAYLCGEDNRGLTNLGVRFGYRF